jgi:hypothetical protein
MRDLIDAFGAEAVAHLKQAGWRKRAGWIFTRELDEEFLLWLGLNRATKYHPLGINPVVGIRYQPLERLLAELRGAKPHTYIPPTISTPLGYLTDENRYLELKVSRVEEAATVALELTRLVETYA